jgi:hypothetical protein
MEKSASAEVRERVSRSKNRFWRPADFSAAPRAVDAALYRLARDGELLRVRRGLYWRGINTIAGMSPPPEDVLAKELVSVGGVGPTGLSALASLGLTTQIPARTWIAVPARPPRPPRGMFFVDRSSRRGRIEARLTPREVAFLEVLSDWDHLIEPGTDAVPRLMGLLRRREIDPSRLVRASRTEPAAVRERLRSLLMTAGLANQAESVSPPRSGVWASTRAA